MDTKSKKWKAVVSFIAFFLGLNMLICALLSGISVLSRGSTARREIQDAFEEDYQATRSFQWEIEKSLGDFIGMAVGGPLDGWGYNSWVDDYYGENTIVEEGMTLFSGDWTDGYRGYAENKENSSSPSEEELREYYLKKAQQAHEYYKNDKNLLYVVSYKGKVKYTNTDGLTVDGPDRKLPEGYNFLLYFDGDKVSIYKDGEELDIYGDGYYREENGDWAVPGYRNFTVDEGIAKATVTIAAAQDPILYICGISGNYSVNSVRSNYSPLYNIVRNMDWSKSIYLTNAVFLLAGLALFVFSCIFHKDRKRARLSCARVTGKIWFEAKLLVLLAAVVVGLFAFTRVNPGLIWMLHTEGYFHWGMLAGDFSMLDRLALPVLFVFWTLYFFINDLRHNDKPWRNTLAGRIAKATRRSGIKLPIQKRLSRWVIWLTVGFVALAVLLLVIFFVIDLWNVALLFCLTIVIILAAVAALLLLGWRGQTVIRDVGSLTGQIQAIRQGNLTVPLPLPEDADLYVAAQNLNDIQRGMNAAMEEQLRSERMKVELIANVSHDIKTPLTSIISYTGLLKEEENLPAHVRDYVRILDEKAQRLKTMVQDVFEVSKATSGNLPVQMETLDFGKLLRQTLADMDGPVSKSGLILKTEIPEAPVLINADGQRLYRVFQNLLQNALKYSLEGSRVYVTLTSNGQSAVASIKNTSKTEIPQDVDFAERFVRGDQSRTDGGSGLGLSIASSFTEACGGRFHMEAIADLFVVTVEFAQAPSDGPAGAGRFPVSPNVS